MATWPAETKAYALELRRQGEFYRKIASAIGKSQKAVEAYFMRMDRLGGKPPRPSLKGLNTFWTQDKKDRLLELLAAGMSRREAANEFGVTKFGITGIVDRMRQAGVLVPCNPPSRHSGARGKGARPPAAPKPPKLAQPLEMTPVGLLERTGCAFPVAYDKQHLFCNNRVNAPTAYCTYHGHVMVNKDGVPFQ